VENNLRFPGQYFDAETGLHQNYFRDYDPKTGRYIQADPIFFQGGLNRYVYVLNDPINLVDPLGLEPGDWRFDPYDHGGPHLQRGPYRYDPKTLEPIPHGGKIPPELSKTAIEDLKGTKAWARWLKYLEKTGKVGGLALAILLELATPADAQAPTLPVGPVLELQQCH